MHRKVTIVVVLVSVALIATAWMNPLDISDEIETYSSVFPSRRDGDGGLVHATYESGGIALFGLGLTSRNYSLGIGFYAPEGCLGRDSLNQKVVVSQADCAELPASGVVQGFGPTTNRAEWVMVWVDVPRSCFQSVNLDDKWPSDAAECGEG